MRKSMVTTSTTLLTLIIGQAACGAGSAGSAVRPDDPTAATALGESCKAVSDQGQPLIVDWKSHQRANLEEAMNGGLAVVAYDCHSLRLLADCRIDGTYGMIAVSRKEDVIELQDADEIRANLPTFGGKLAVDFEAEMHRGSALNLAIILVGKKKTTTLSVERAQLRGSCDGASHFVRGAFLGAFAMGTATRGKVRAAASLFGAQSAGESTSSKSVKNSDGDRDACLQIAPGANGLPAGCSALLRLELGIIAASAGVGKVSGQEEQAAAVCPTGMVLSQGKCARATATRPYDCTAGVAECVSECEKGSALSCTRAGRIYAIGEAATQDFPRAVSLFQRACDKGDAHGCSSLGTSYRSGEGVPQDTARALTLYAAACEAGEPHGCSGLGMMNMGGPNGIAKNLGKAVPLLRRACDGGEGRACMALGQLHLSGDGVPQDRAQAVGLIRRGCAGRAPQSCEWLKAAGEQL